MSIREPDWVNWTEEQWEEAREEHERRALVRLSKILQEALVACDAAQLRRDEAAYGELMKRVAAVGAWRGLR